MNYRFHSISLKFEETQTDVLYNRLFFKQDLYSLRFVIVLGVILSLAFIFVDFFNYSEKLVSIVFRGGMALLLSIFGASTYFFKEKNYKATQWIAMGVSILVTTVFFFHYHLNTDVGFKIFLSNILTVLIFIFSTIMGFRFRYSIIINSLVFIAYIFYVQYINYNLISERQISQLVVVFLVSNTAAYVLERQKINAFINRNELNLQKNKVEDLNTLKNKLLSVISHDLRGPIDSLKGMISLFNKKALTEEEISLLSKDIEKDLNSTSSLLENVLAWAKSQLEGIDYTPKKLNLLDLVTEITSLYKTQLQNKAIEISVDIDNQQCIWADLEMMHIVIRNLVSNAIKFTPVGGKISIDSNKDGEFIALKVKDSGPGIPQDKLRNLYSIHNEKVVGGTQDVGAGLGLILVKEFIELNQGSIACESSLHRGTVFTVKIPQC